MVGAWLDRLTRVFLMPFSRRALFIILSFIGGGIGQRAATGTQLGPATCGSQREVCTLLRGCCSGLTCVTSGTNPSYGVCVTGSGGMLPVSSSLISPHSTLLDEEIVSLAETVAANETSSGFDLEAERDARVAEIKARKDAKRSKRKTRLDTKRDKRRTRNDEQQNRRSEAAKTATPTRTPNPTRTPAPTRTPVPTRTPTPTPTSTPDPAEGLELAVTCPQRPGVSQVVTITNSSARDVVIDTLTSLLVTPGGDEPFRGVGTVEAGSTLQVFFGTDPSGTPPYSSELIFNDSAQEGVRVTFDTGAILTACCEGTTCLEGVAQIASSEGDPTRVRTRPGRVQDSDTRKRKTRR